MPFTMLDVILIVIALLSGVLAMMRGFSREVLSVLGWVCAAGAGIYTFFSPNIKSITYSFITPEWLADIVTVSGVFLATLLLISFSTVRISDMILDSRIGFLDRTLGFLFGLVRGIAIVLMAYMLFSKLIPTDAHPDWMKKARTAGLLQSWSEMVYNALPNDAAAQIKSLKDKNKEQNTMPQAVKSTAPAASPITPPAASYKEQDKKALEKQIQNIGKSQ